MAATQRSSEKAILLNGEHRVVVGITPSNFEFPKGVTVWIPRGLRRARTTLSGRRRS